MPLIVKGSDRKFAPAPAGVFYAVCCDVVDLGEVTTPWGDKDMLQLRWQIDEINEEANTVEPQRHMVVKRYTKSLDRRSNLRKDLEAWRGKPFTDDELQGFDVENLLGVNCQIQIAHAVKDNGDVWANVQAVIAQPRGAVKLRVENYTRVCDRDEGTTGNGGGFAAKHEDLDEIPF